MRNEQKQTLYFLEAVFVASIFGALYAVGGSEDFGGMKWIRRFLAPALFSIWMFLRSKDWRSFCGLPLMIGGLCLPYGAESTAGKLGLRTLFGSVVGIGSTAYSLLNGFFKLAFVQIFLCAFVSAILGTFNPFPQNAMAEQGAIGFTFVFLPALILKRKD